MKIQVFSFLVWLSWTAALGQPATEIFLFDLKVKGGTVLLDNGKNITNHKGYDNQPYFHPDKSLLYYSAADSTGKTDIFVYDYDVNSTKRLTNTGDREYSPTVTPDKLFISCIIQRENGDQDLGKYPINGGNPLVVLDNLTVGYHAWMNEGTLVLFILGDPPTLRLVNIAEKRDTVIAQNIGRSLHRIPNSSAVSFVQKSENSEWQIKRLDAKTNTLSTVAASLPGREDLAWTPDGLIIMSDGAKVYSINPLKDKTWREIKFRAAVPLKGISRININAKGDRIALVAEE